MQGLGFAIVALIARLLRLDREEERPAEIQDELVVFHHHTRGDSPIVWHRHATKLIRHPYPFEKAHPGVRDA